MNPRAQMSPYSNNSYAIRQEIQRFESVHPSIYAIYDLIEAVPDPLIQSQIREHVVCIEDSFVNSQEWTISRSVPDLKLGILGSFQSGKSALVHRYLTGSYMQEESPEGGRFKKEVLLDGSSHLLLIRDEGGEPEMQFTHWVDAIIFVFSLENERSFNCIYTYYAKMGHFRNVAEVPIILVGTQDAISESNPRVIDDTRARKLASDLRRCSYYETCATYGLNVERVFQDACQKILQLRMQGFTPNNSRPNTPNQAFRTGSHFSPHTQQLSSSKSYENQSSVHQPGIMSAGGTTSTHSIQNSPGTLTSKDHKHDKKHKHKDNKDLYRDRGDRERASDLQRASDPPLSYGSIPVAPPSVPPSVPPSAHQQLELIQQLQQMQMEQQHQQQLRNDVTPGSTPIPSRKNKKSSVQKSNSFSFQLRRPPDKTDKPPFQDKPSSGGNSGLLGGSGDGGAASMAQGGGDTPTPSGTPTQKRKDRRRSNLFSKKGEETEKSKPQNGQLGVGRTIPLKQGILYKKSNKPLNKDWKKKYVTLSEGRLSYHPSLHDYMDDVHGKEINLMRTTVKVPGQKPRGSRQSSESQANGKQPPKEGNVLISAFNDETIVLPNSPNADLLVTPNSKIETPNVKKRHKRMKSGAKNLDTGQDIDSDGYEFHIVSLDNKQWHFEATTHEEREEWVTAIEQQILSSLQSNQSNKSKSGTGTGSTSAQSIRQVPGNLACADCGDKDPEWASLNLGSLICIECSGIHRNLGTHLSRVRSLTLDEWPPELIAVMAAVGNTALNSIWEANCKGRTKPSSTSPRDDKESWIRAKYEQKEFIPPPPYHDVPIPQQLIDAIARQDVGNTILVLAYCSAEYVNAPYSKSDTRTAVHIAAALGNVVLLQLLIWYGANVKMVDHEGRNALWYAHTSGSKECVELLRQQGCPESGTLQRRRASSQTQPNMHPSNLPSNESIDKMQSSIMH